MIKRIALLSALLLAGCQTTQTPPPEYVHPYRGELHIHYAADLHAECLAFNNPDKIFGCAFVWSKSCDVYILSTEPPDSQAQIKEHELAHCNGWPAEHNPSAPWPL